MQEEITITVSKEHLRNILSLYERILAKEEKTTLEAMLALEIHLLIQSMVKDEEIY